MFSGRVARQNNGLYALRVIVKLAYMIIISTSGQPSPRFHAEAWLSPGTVKWTIGLYASLDVVKPRVFGCKLLGLLGVNKILSVL